ncbi:phosphoglycerate mutase [Longimycelium tulufanense]|uniref:Phosphoglycerate mutase n=1 Tax=Longimycelium tulufanense TaxID=907463 RepID=A0A8J3FSV1_9PSEU|nr:phosphoglycerate mutase [Longimycelium tulufanense]
MYVVRHGETEWSAAGKHTSYSDIPLTPNGEQAARFAGEVLARLRGTDEPPSLVLSSPRQRAVRTAQLAGLRPEVTEHLAEWNYGEYEGVTTTEIRRTVPDWNVWTHGSLGGESVAEVGARADAVLARAREALSDGDVVLAGHGHFGRVLAARWVDLPVAAGAHLGLAPASWTVLGYERENPQLIHVNVPPWSLR